MTLDELRERCLLRSPLDGEPVQHVYLTVPRKTLPRGDSIRMLGRSGPTGRLCNVTRRQDGRYDCVAVFRTKDVLRMLDDAGA